MDTTKTRKILNKLIVEFPRQLSLSDFDIPEEEKQSFASFLMELAQRQLIDAKFLVSRQRESVGVPYDAIGISISKEGRDFMEGKNENKPVNQTIHINASGGSSVPLNVAAGDININNDIDVENLLEKLLENIGKTNLPQKEKESLATSVKSMFATSAPAIVAGILIESFKSVIGGG